ITRQPHCDPTQACGPAASATGRLINAWPAVMSSALTHRRQWRGRGSGRAVGPADQALPLRPRTQLAQMLLDIPIVVREWIHRRHSLTLGLDPIPLPLARV